MEYEINLSKIVLVEMKYETFQNEKVENTIGTRIILNTIHRYNNFFGIFVFQPSVPK